LTVTSFFSINESASRRDTPRCKARYLFNLSCGFSLDEGCMTTYYTIVSLRLAWAAAAAQRVLELAVEAALAQAVVVTRVLA
jgi:hypothetical protein